MLNVLKASIQEWVNTRLATDGAKPVRKVVFVLHGLAGSGLLEAPISGVKFVDNEKYRLPLFVELVKPSFMVNEEDVLEKVRRGTLTRQEASQLGMGKEDFLRDKERQEGASFLRDRASWE